MGSHAQTVGGIAGAIMTVVGLALGAAHAGVMQEPQRAAGFGQDVAPMRAARLWVGFAEVLNFPEPVGTIVVGDAGILDASVIDESTVVLTALTAGRTNVVVLGQEGAVFSRLSVVVRAPQPPTTEVFRGAERTVLICDPDCAPVSEGGEPQSE